MSNQVEHITIQRMEDGKIHETADQVAVEEPLEIQLIYSTATGKMHKNIAVTMRTPGNDEELAAGFLFTENIIPGKSAIKEIKHIASDENRVLITLQENIIPLLNNAERNFYTTSSCGICGKASIDAIRTFQEFEQNENSLVVKYQELFELQNRLKDAQKLFTDTGGIHASALFTTGGEFIMLREDVGRHNALDKLIGAAFIEDSLPLDNHILLLSGRASFELIQKAAMAAIKIVVAVGAPSSLAIDMAKEAGITLIGFLRNNRFNIYTGKQRIIY